MLLALVLVAIAIGDPVGDAGGSPDVTHVASSVASGKLRVVVTTADASAWTNAAAFLSIDLTGDGKTDVDYTLHSLHDLVTRDTATGPVATTATATLAGATLTYIVPLAELGKRTVVGLEITTAGPIGGDRAPDTGLTTVRLVPTVTPTQPVHGRKFKITGATTCTARIGTARLKGRCAWTIPLTAKGKTLVVTAGGARYRVRVR